MLASKHSGGFMQSMFSWLMANWQSVLLVILAVDKDLLAIPMLAGNKVLVGVQSFLGAFVQPKQ